MWHLKDCFLIFFKEIGAIPRVRRRQRRTQRRPIRVIRFHPFDPFSQKDTTPPTRAINREPKDFEKLEAQRY
jgi:hypothetical protein